MKKVILFLAALILVVSCGKKEKILYVYNWSDYIDPDLVTEFEKQNECKVVLDTYNSNENMLTKVANATGSYDIAFPSGDHVVIMKDQDLLEKIDKSKLTNYKNLNPKILEKCASFDEGNEYSIPYFWGTAGLVYNRKQLPDEEMKDVSWNIIADKRFEGKNVITLLDDARSVVGAALKYTGHSLNDMSPEALAAAQEVLKVWDKNVSQYDAESYKNEIQDGTSWLAHGYNGDALQVMAENEDVGFVHPKEGTELWIDNFVILKNAENKELAYRFVDFLLDAEIGARNAEWVQYATPNLASYNLLDDSIKANIIMYPTAEYLEKCEFIKNVGEDIVNLNKVWEEIINY